VTRGFLVVVTGLLAEARLAQQPGGRAIASGGDPGRLEAELDLALSRGAAAVLSFGVSAGLQPGRPPGTLVIPVEIIGGSAHYQTDPRWSEQMRSLLGSADRGPLAGVDSPLVRSIDKASLHSATGAVAADMESHLAARWARRAGRPFAALRVISDPAERSLPPAAAIGMRSDGRINVTAVVGSLVRNPRQLSDLAGVANDVRVAMQVLRHCRSALGPDLGWTSG
jgi:hopanoid-associated phosphorylase